MADILWQIRNIRLMVDPITINRNDPFQTLIKTILSHRTKDENTDKASEVLFKSYPDARSLKSASLGHVEKLIRPVGFFTVKAGRVIEVARIIDEELDGIVPRTKEELMKLPGVGPKTANCVLVFAYGFDAIPVDTHVHRIANRLGWVKTKDPVKTEEALMKIVPKEQWLMLNELLVNFGKKVCRPTSPKCGICLIKDSCKYYQDTSSLIKEKSIDN